MKHFVTTYTESGIRWAEAWLQINIFGKSYCFWKKRTKIIPLCFCDKMKGE